MLKAKKFTVYAPC